MISVVLSFPQKVQYSCHRKYPPWLCASKCKHSSHRSSSARGTWGKLHSLIRVKQKAGILPFHSVPMLMSLSWLHSLQHRFSSYSSRRKVFASITARYVVLQSSAGWRITMHNLLENLRCFLSTLSLKSKIVAFKACVDREWLINKKKFLITHTTPQNILEVVWHSKTVL